MADKKLFRDPIYNFISFDKEKDKVLLELIKTPEFLRLKRIKQLGVSYYTYPSAVHDRFSHSIGVSYLIGLIYDRLNVPQNINVIDSDGESHEINKDNFKLLLQTAGLLHDIGHGPFSHAFDRIKNLDFKHEKIMINILGRNSIRNIFEKEFQNQFLKQHAVECIKELINNTFSVRWANEIISSQIDADRIDFLLRDAYMCGVEYVSFDYDWLLYNMRIDNIPSENREGLIIDAQKGLHSLESFIISRYHMYEQVYHHKTTSCFVILLKCIITRVRDLINKECLSDLCIFDNSIVKFLKDQSDIDSFLKLDDNYIMTYISLWAEKSSDEILKELSKCFFYRRPYKMIKEIKGESPFHRSDFDIMNKHFNNDTEKRDCYCIEDSYITNPYKDEYLLGTKLAAEAEHIWVNLKDNMIVELSEASDLIKALKNYSTKTNRAYVHRDHYESLIEKGLSHD